MKALFVSYGGGHVEMCLPVLRALRERVPGVEARILALTTAAGVAAVIMRQTRSSMLDALSTDFVRTAEAKGLKPRAVIGRHALRNSLIVVVTIVGLQLGGLISGAVVTEQIFGLPGFGKMTIDAVFQRDYPVIQAVVLVTATSYILINFAVDLLYSLIDPRVRVAGEAS
jgi:peptide/nickel transport system permease protein